MTKLVMRRTDHMGDRRRGRSPWLALWMATVAAGAGLALAACVPAKAPPPPSTTQPAPTATTLPPPPGIEEFDCTGGSQEWVVPAGVVEATFVVDGAEGGNASTPNGGAGGLGGRVEANIAVAESETIQVNVGCEGEDGLRHHARGADAGPAGLFAGGGGGGGGYHGGGGGGSATIGGGSAGGGGGDSAFGPLGTIPSGGTITGDGHVTITYDVP